ncbi:MAG: hypothetical protein Q4E53_09745 [Eubacteriales bacterium]|nr:hypothetical protein [Eubacteriales bacterium]
MKPRSEKSMELYHLLLQRGYPEVFCYQISQELNTDFTAKRMIGYLSHYKKLPMEDVADEMLAILSDRSAIIQKKEMEYYQSKINEMYRYGLEVDDEE